MSRWAPCSRRCRAISARPSSTQFNKFGLTFQVYVQADQKYRLSTTALNNLYVKNTDGQMVPLGTLAKITPTVGPSLISLYNLYPSASIVGSPAPGFSSGQSMQVMEQLANQALPRGAGYEWTAMSYQEKVTGNQIYYVFSPRAAARLSRARRTV